MTARRLMYKLNHFFPHSGPCAFCGDWDARHRLFDAIRARRQDGESIASLAEDYGQTSRAIKYVMAYHDKDMGRPI